MYKQTINHIKVAIIPLDGIVYDLNRFRYNYYHHLCDSYKMPLDKEVFYNHLSNMYDMYKELPLKDRLDVGPLNAKIERELLEYLTHKGLKPRDGFFELLEYLRQKGIQVAIMSTHRTKDAVQYLQMSKLYHKVQFIIGSDTSSLPLPSTQILETIQNHFQVENSEVLVFSPFISLNLAANQLQMNVLYCEDLIEAGEREKQTSYKCVKNIFEALNVLLFDRYEEVDMYSPILGMNKDMSYDELEEVHDKLQVAYHDDPKLIDLVDQTYAYHISQFQQNEMKEKPVIKERVSSSKRFSFEDDLEEGIQQARTKSDIQNIQENQEIIETQEESVQHFNPLNQQEEDELTLLLQQINKKPETPVKTVTDFKTIQDIVTTSIEEDEEVEEEVSQQEETSSSILNFITDLLNIFALSFLILFIGIVFYVAFIPQFDKGEGIFRILSICFSFYNHIIETIFKTFFNALHQLISLIPSYQDYVYANPIFSEEGVGLLNIFVFNIIVMGTIKIFMSVLGGSDEDDE